MTAEARDARRYRPRRWTARRRSVAAVSRSTASGAARRARARRHLARRSSRRVRLPRRRVRLRQEHAAQPRRRPRPPDRRAPSTVAGRVALMFQEAALFPWLTVRRNVELASSCAACRKRERRSRGRRAAAARSTSTGSATSGRTSCPAACASGSRRPGLRPGGRHAAHGRAVRRARRDDPRPAPRRARTDLGRREPDRRVRHPQRPRGRPPRPTASCCSRAGPGRVVERVRRRHRATRAASTPPRCPRWPPRSPTSCARRCAAMPAHEIDAATELDRRLDASWPGSTPSSWPAPRAVRSPAGSGQRRGRSWPPSASRSAIWQAVVWPADGGPSTSSRRPRSCATRSWNSCANGTLWTARSRRRCAAPRRLRARHGDRHGRRGGGVPGPGAARRVRLVHHRPADDAVDRVVPARRPALQADRSAIYFVVDPRRRAVDRQRSDRRRRHTSRRCCCGPAARWAHGAATLLPPRRAARRRCRRSWPGSSRAGRSPGAA